MINVRLSMLRILGLILAGSVLLAQPPSVVWEWQIGGTGDYIAVDATITELGDVAFSGSHATSLNGDRYFFYGMVSADGDCLWTRVIDTLRYAEANGILSSSDGNLVMVGDRSDSLDNWMRDGLICTAGLSGSLLAVHDVGGPQSEEIESFAPTPDGGHVLCGYRIPGGGDPGNDLYLAKVDSSGSVIWERGYRPTIQSVARGMRVIPVHAGGYAAIGSVRFMNNPPYASEYYLVRINEDGDTLWTRFYGDTNLEDEATSLAETSDGDFILVGNSAVEDLPVCTIHLIRVSSAGNELWSRVLPLPTWRYPWAQDITASLTGDWIVGGQIESLHGNGFDYLLVCINSNGDTLWHAEYPTGGDGTVYRILPAVDDGYIAVGTVLTGGFSRHAVRALRLTRENQAAQYKPLPTAFTMLSNYPNPFNSTTQIEFILPTTQRVSLRLYDVLGREVAVMMNEIQTAGAHRLTFDASGMPSGVYLCRLEAGEMMQTRKMVLLK